MKMWYAKSLGLSGFRGFAIKKKESILMKSGYILSEQSIRNRDEMCKG